MTAVEMGTPVEPPLKSKLARAVNWTLEAMAMILMASLAGLVFINASSRYALGRPLPWTEEMVIYLLAWLAALGVVLAGMRQALICCDVLSRNLTAPAQRKLSIACGVLGTAVMLYCSWLTWRYLGLFGRDLSPILRIPKGVIIGAVFFAMIGLSATLIASLFKRR